ncbi:HNH endonuclease signature motif containing protein [Cupriavidus sp. RAF12]|uniref:HNH endonuclease signature motif containing protein n=1 Tax=Cupriavidus sp. RAF12 TaxID=3233050 RepID=UPI003F9098A5
MERNQYQLTHSTLLARLRYDHATGQFYRKNGEVAGTAHGNHRRMYIDGEFVYEHVLAWFYVHACWPDGLVDHIDGCGTNNRMENLRVVTVSTNNLNRRDANRNNRTGILGVHPHSTGYRAQLRVEGVTHRSAVQPTAEDAGREYQRLRMAHCPEARPYG